MAGDDIVTREAACECGQLRIVCEGEPLRVSICHCLACQRRTGSVFGVQARWAQHNVRSVVGNATEYVRTGDAGGRATYRFCPQCGTTVYFTIDTMPDMVVIAVGAFADPDFPPPIREIYTARRHGWVAVEGITLESLS